MTNLLASTLALALLVTPGDDGAEPELPGDYPAGYQDSPEDAALRATLRSRRVTLHFEETSLENVAAFLHDITGCPVRLEDEASGRSPVSLQVTDMSLASALDLISLGADAAWALRDGVIVLGPPALVFPDPASAVREALARLAGSRDEEAELRGRLATRRVDLDLRDAPLETVLDYLQRLDLDLVVANGVSRGAGAVNLRLRDVSLRAVLDLVADQAAVAFRVHGGALVVEWPGGREEREAEVREALFELAVTRRVLDPRDTARLVEEETGYPAAPTPALWARADLPPGSWRHVFAHGIGGPGMTLLLAAPEDEGVVARGSEWLDVDDGPLASPPTGSIPTCMDPETARALLNLALELESARLDLEADRPGPDTPEDARTAAMEEARRLSRFVALGQRLEALAGGAAASRRVRRLGLPLPAKLKPRDGDPLAGALVHAGADGLRLRRDAEVLDLPLDQVAILWVAEGTEGLELVPLTEDLWQRAGGASPDGQDGQVLEDLAVARALVGAGAGVGTAAWREVARRIGSVLAARPGHPEAKALEVALEAVSPAPPPPRSPRRAY